MATIDESFTSLINSKEAETDLDIDRMELLKFRYALREGLPVSTDTKLELLFRSGWSQSLHEYNQADLVSVLKYGQRKKKASKN